MLFRSPKVRPSQQSRTRKIHHSWHHPRDFSHVVSPSQPSLKENSLFGVIGDNLLVILFALTVNSPRKHERIAGLESCKSFLSEFPVNNDRLPALNDGSLQDRVSVCGWPCRCACCGLHSYPRPHLRYQAFREGKELNCKTEI